MENAENVGRSHVLAGNLSGRFCPSECCLLLNIIQYCSMSVLEQLKLAKLGPLECGLRCYSKKCTVKEPHPSECTDEDQFIFACLVKGSQWKEENSERSFWFKGMYLHYNCTWLCSTSEPSIQSFFIILTHQLHQKCVYV